MFETGLERFTSDERIWTYAKENGYVIVTADADFVRLAETLGPPPRVIWLEGCNYGNEVTEKLLRRNAIRIAELGQSDRSILRIRNTP